MNPSFDAPAPAAPQPADHGGGIDAAAARFGGARADWLDLSTGINPRAYQVGQVPAQTWTTLPDHAAQTALIAAARAFWNVPAAAAVIAAPGASSLIALIPQLAPPARAHVATPTYNEHARAFAAQGWTLTDAPGAQAAVIVHPNNPDGRRFSIPAATLTVIDESFCDVTPDATHIAAATRPGTLILKSFGKFWGLAGVRLGFAIGDPALIAGLETRLGPWRTSGPALYIGTQALRDTAWASASRTRLAADAARLDRLMAPKAALVGGTSLFRLYDVADAAQWQTHLARHQIWTRIFPYSTRWLRLGLPDAPADWARLETAVATL